MFSALSPTALSPKRKEVRRDIEGLDDDNIEDDLVFLERIVISPGIPLT